jgi:peptidoglycan/xylan/chitin deacetylase (PgdA/CDA1 family)
LTFDDGFRSHYDVARCLSAIGVKATFFITTHTYGENFLASTPEKIIEMSEMGHEIGSHSCTHPNFLLLSASERERELKESRKWLENLLGKNIRSFAYPYFLYDEKVLRDTHRFYLISRSRCLHVGSCKVDMFRVHFLTRKNLLSILSNSILKNTENSGLITLHNIKSFQIPFILSALGVLTQTMPRQVRFVTISELAHLLTGGALRDSTRLEPEVTTC